MFRRLFSTLAERQLVVQKGSDFLVRHQPTIAGLSALFAIYLGLDIGLRNLKTDIASDIAELKTDIAAVKTQSHTDIAELRSQGHADSSRMIQVVLLSHALSKPDTLANKDAVQGLLSALAPPPLIAPPEPPQPSTDTKTVKSG